MRKFLWEGMEKSWPNWLSQFRLPEKPGMYSILDAMPLSLKNLLLSLLTNELAKFEKIESLQHYKKYQSVVFC